MDENILQMEKFAEAPGSLVKLSASRLSPGCEGVCPRAQRDQRLRLPTEEDEEAEEEQMGGGKAAGAVGPVGLLTSWREPAATGDIRRPAQYLASVPAHAAQAGQTYVDARVCARAHTCIYTHSSYLHTLKLVSVTGQQVK